MKIIEDFKGKGRAKFLEQMDISRVFQALKQCKKKKKKENIN